ncbi:hypothetical protein [Burkholderia multivorans]|uniref:hypothetical protein n=1 Tax=Burkholderia multivorans TaxID=87883 RepID=UPI0005BACB12|nr:hypothetical protein [Burkholderia multivorans]MBU9472109.1 hypothetical protein [Burkholderia multivorans]
MQNKLCADDYLPFLIHARFDLEHKAEALDLQGQIEQWKAQNDALLTPGDQFRYEVERSGDTAFFVFWILLNDSQAKLSFHASLPVELTFIQKTVDRRIKEIIEKSLLH